MRDHRESVRLVLEMRKTTHCSRMNCHCGDEDALLGRGSEQEQGARQKGYMEGP